MSLAKNRMETAEGFLADGHRRPRPARGLGLAALPGVPRPHAVARLRRPAAGDGAPAARARGRARALPEALPLRPGRRVPGHEPPAVRDREADRRRAPQRLRGGRRRPVDLRLARAPTSRRSSASTTTSRARRSSACRRTTARRGRSWTRPTWSSARTPSRHEKALESARGDGEPVRFARLKDETAEAQFVVEEMRKLLRLEEAKPADFAILCRTQVQFRPFEGELRANGLPYVVVGGMSFFDRKEVRDIVAYLKLAVNPRDETSLLRIINTPVAGRGEGEPRPRPGVRHRARHLRRRGLRARGGDRGPLAAGGRGLPEAAGRARRRRARRRGPRTSSPGSSVSWRRSPIATR